MRKWGEEGRNEEHLELHKVSLSSMEFFEEELWRQWMEFERPDSINKEKKNK